MIISLICIKAKILNPTLSRRFSFKRRRKRYRKVGRLDSHCSIRGMMGTKKNKTELNWNK